MDPEREDHDQRLTTPRTHEGTAFEDTGRVAAGKSLSL